MGGDPFLTVLSRPAELPPTEMWAQNQEKCVSLTRSPSVRIILHCLVLQTFVLCNNPGTLYRRQSLCCLPLEPHCPEALPHSNCEYGGGRPSHGPRVSWGPNRSLGPGYSHFSFRGRVVISKNSGFLAFFELYFELLLPCCLTSRNTRGLDLGQNVGATSTQACPHTSISNRGRHHDWFTRFHSRQNLHQECHCEEN